MNEIKSIEQLQYEKKQLKLQLKEIEQELKDEAKYINTHIQPLFNVIEFAKNKILPFTGGAAKFALPLLLGKFAKGAKIGANSSVWGIAATLATDFVVKNVDFSAIVNKVTGLFHRQKQKDESELNEI